MQLLRETKLWNRSANGWKYSRKKQRKHAWRSRMRKIRNGPENVAEESWPDALCNASGSGRPQLRAKLPAASSRPLTVYMRGPDRCSRFGDCMGRAPTRSSAGIVEWRPRGRSLNAQPQIRICPATDGRGCCFIAAAARPRVDEPSEPGCGRARGPDPSALNELGLHSCESAKRCFVHRYLACA